MTHHDSDDSTRKPPPSNQAEDSQSLFDKVLPDGVRRGVESLLREGRLRQLMGEMKLPKEIVAYMLTQIDETKQAAVTAVGRELRLFLERTSLADELTKLLTKMSFQIKTEVRFVPREDARKETRAQGKRIRRKRGSMLWPLRPVITHQVGSASHRPAQAGTDETDR